MAKTIPSITRYLTRLKTVLRHPFFWVLTLGANAVVILGAVLLHYFETGPNESKTFLDSLLWSMGTVTTIGYGNSVPQTFYGKLVLLGLMPVGALLLWSYMAFLVAGLLTPELFALENDIHNVEKEIQEIEKGVHHIGKLPKKK